MKKWAAALVFLFALDGARSELRVPAFTAYVEPDPDGARVSERSGISHWTDPSLSVVWFGHIKSPGKLECALLLRLPAGDHPPDDFPWPRK